MILWLVIAALFVLAALTLAYLQGYESGSAYADQALDDFDSAIDEGFRAGYRASTLAADPDLAADEFTAAQRRAGRERSQ